MTLAHRPPSSELERRLREAALDRTIADTFPASDPPSTIPDPLDESLLRDEHDRPGATGEPGRTRNAR